MKSITTQASTIKALIRRFHLKAIGPWLIVAFFVGLFSLAEYQLLTWQPEPIVDYGIQPVKAQLIPSHQDQGPTHQRTEQDPIPIVMYHYIRDYQVKRDRVGVNLSVSPETFTHQLDYLKSHGYNTITLSELGQPLPARPIIITFDDGYDDAASAALPALEKAGMRGVFYIISDFVDKPRYLTSQQIKEMASKGMEIGSHTRDHHDLAKLDEVHQRKELAESKARLEELIGKPVTSFCYPAGRYNQITTRLAKEIGYTTATTTKPGITYDHDLVDKPFELTRLRVTNTTDFQELLGKLEK